MPRISLPAASLAKIDFGAPAAERDIERGLDEYFVESEAYERVRLGSKRMAAVRSFQVHPMFWAHLGNGTIR